MPSCPDICPYQILIFFLLSWGLRTRQPLWVILCYLKEKEKRDRRDSRGDEREGQERKRKMNESAGTEEIKTFPLYPYLLQGQQALPNCKPISVGRSQITEHFCLIQPPPPLPNIKLSRIVWKLWPAQDFGFRGDKYIMKKVRVVSLAATRLLVLFLSLPNMKAIH